MKGICRGRAAIGRGGLEPPGPAFADQRVTFPGNRGDLGGRGLLLGFHVGLSGWSFADFLIGAGGVGSSLPLSWQRLWHRGLAPAPAGSGLPLGRDR